LHETELQILFDPRTVNCVFEMSATFMSFIRWSVLHTVLERYLSV